MNDYINGLFEIVGAYFTWKNFFVLKKEKQIKGVYWPIFAFFASWGIWNLIYYPSLHQWASFAGAAFLCAGNVAWAVYAAILKYKT